MIETADLVRLIVEDNASDRLGMDVLLADTGMSEATLDDLTRRIASAALETNPTVQTALIGAAATAFSIGWKVRDQYGRAS